MESALIDHLRFAFVCAEDRHHAGLMSDGEYRELQSLISSGQEPDQILMTLCFPRMVRDLRDYARRRRVDNIWSSEICLDYWTKHHGHNQDPSCEVSIKEITKVANIRIVYAGDTVLRNIYEINLNPGDNVYVHKSAVVRLALLSE
jgi:hypothetical protein